MNIYVGNLSFDITQDELQQAFAAHGEVASASVIEDKYTGRSRGFGFVEMPKDEEARTAIEQMNETDLKGRKLNVNEAKPRTESPRGGGGGGRSW
ncbi:RNA recognition motif domain-containing protein [Candidatus Eisenbacteria bacterium]|uniref:RNA recognition motif domain-containing protein n=1 Tax=Eiseniibacteriota bacterium TaxID=2212470 RepID=A0ABV6YNR0_UNCEI